MSRTGAIEIASELRSRSFQAWLTGGCVRDLVLGREPKDYDIATDARPDRSCSSCFPGLSWWGRSSAWCWWMAWR